MRSKEQEFFFLILALHHPQSFCSLLIVFIISAISVSTVNSGSSKFSLCFRWVRGAITNCEAGSGEVWGMFNPQEVPGSVGISFVCFLWISASVLTSNLFNSHHYILTLPQDFLLQETPPLHILVSWVNCTLAACLRLLPLFYGIFF